MSKVFGRAGTSRGCADSPGLLGSGVLSPGDAFQLLFDDHPAPMMIHELESGRFVAVNDAAVRFYGHGRKAFLAMEFGELSPAADEHDRDAASDPGPSTRVFRHVRKDGSMAWVELRSFRFTHRGREHVLTTVFDVTEWMQVRRQLGVQAAYFRQLFENSPEGIVILDDHDRIVEANKGFQAMFKYSAKELKGRAINDVIVPDAHRHEASGLSGQVLEGDRIESETIRVSKDGDLIEVSILGYPITLNGDRLGVYGIYRDITERKRLAGLMAHQASHDALTDLLNRPEFERRLARLVREREGEHALLFVDINQFKVVNEIHGHAAGDDLLRKLAKLIRRNVRKSDWVARLGGDEFAVLLYGCDRQRAGKLARKLLEAIQRFRFVWNERRFSLSAAIGLVEIDEWMESLSDVLTAAETAVFAAKKSNTDQIQTYDPDSREMAEFKGEISWITPINEALAEDRFVLFYQRMEPVAGISGPPGDELDERYELLVRMCGDSGTLVAPSTFIPTAERYNLMPAVDRWVISKAFTELASRFRSGKSERVLVSINVSGTTLNSEGISEFVAEEFRESGVPPHCICFEITETAAITNLEEAQAFIMEMKKLGASIALDDFGSGMSSFSYLKALPVDFIKIDGIFIRDMLRDSMDMAIVDAVNRIGKVLGIATVAEYVETETILAKLRELNVDFAQGYAIHRPEPWISKDSGAAGGGKS